MNHHSKRQRHELARKRHRHEHEQQARAAAKAPRPKFPVWLLGIAVGLMLLAAVIVAVAR